MVTMTTLLPQGRPLTQADLEALPDDGHRYELVHGTLIVTPSPVTRHQQIVLEIAVALRAVCPAELSVFVAPLDVLLAVDTVLQPDVLVARRSDLTEINLPTAPILAIEVLSPSTRHIDLGLKRAVYEEAGCPSYWVVDPDDPTLTAWELQDGRYVEVARVSGDEAFEATHPFPVEIVPSDLLG
jgi:Uma2 family endonuclease